MIPSSSNYHGPVIARFIATERAHLGITTDSLSVLAYYDRGGNARIEIHQKETP